MPWALAPDGQYYDLSYRDLRHPSMTLWEHRWVLKRLREEGHLHVDEGVIFRTLDTLRTITDEAVVRSKTARRQRERRLRLIQGGLTPAESANPSKLEQSDDAAVDKQQPWEQMLPVEEWT